MNSVHVGMFDPKIFNALLENGVAVPIHSALGTLSIFALDEDVPIDRIGYITAEFINTDIGVIQQIYTVLIKSPPLLDPFDVLDLDTGKLVDGGINQKIVSCPENIYYIAALGEALNLYFGKVNITNLYFTM